MEEWVVRWAKGQLTSNVLPLSPHTASPGLPGLLVEIFLDLTGLEGRIQRPIRSAKLQSSVFLSYKLNFSPQNGTHTQVTQEWELRCHTVQGA